MQSLVEIIYILSKLSQWCRVYKVCAALK